MQDNDTLLKNRISELASRSESRGIHTYTEFLSLAEQDILLRMKIRCPFLLTGGYDMAERRIAVFGDDDAYGTGDDPIVCLSISPVIQKFSDELTHRDFLGSLMSLGIRREVLGDIVVNDNCGYIFCLSSVQDYIISQLETVKHTTVKTAKCEVPPTLSKVPDVTSAVVSSERLDAIISAVYRFSRSESQSLISSGKVFISGRLTTSQDTQLSPGDIVSVRGTGRFVYEGMERETKKGRLRVNVRIY